MLLAIGWEFKLQPLPTEKIVEDHKMPEIQAHLDDFIGSVIREDKSAHNLNPIVPHEENLGAINTDILKIDLYFQSFFSIPISSIHRFASSFLNQ